MTQRLAGKLVSLLLMVILPTVTLSAASPAAMMYASGSVLVNGIVAPASSAIFDGDRLSTTPKSVVNVVLAGSSVTLAPESSILFEKSSVALEIGSVSVATTKRVSARAGSITILPVASTETRYLVARGDNVVSVSAATGIVKVVNNGTEILLAEGKAMSFTDDQDQGQEQSQRKKGGAPPTAPPAGGVSKGAAVIAGVAVAGAAAAIVFVTTRSSVSPSSP